MAILKIRKPDGSVQEVQTLVGPKGDTGATGPQGPAGSDASVTSQNIATALGFTPANAATVSQQSAEIAELQTDKQDKLIAGSGITIADDGKTISASGGGGGASERTYELIETITLTEDVTSIERDKEPDGTPYCFDELYIKINNSAKLAQGGSTRLNYRVHNSSSDYGFYMSYSKITLNTISNRSGIIKWTSFGDDYGYGAETTRYNVASNDIFGDITKIKMSTTSSAPFKSGAVIKIYGMRHNT